MPAYPDTIAEPVTHELVVKRSRFVAHVAPVSSTSEAQDVVAAARRQHWDARHHCSAVVTGVRGDQARSSDDGEPSGTAGMPMLEVLRRRDLTDLVAVVSRYFGGVKLGAGGLVRAYSTAVSEALDQARLLSRVELREARVEVGHADAGRVDNGLRDWADAHGATIGDVVYGAAATFTLWVPPHAEARLVDDVAALSAGALTPVFGSVRVVDV
ncbi:YigZ family protein [Nocardioides sp. C4-1]|uniref:IMPACT family protein n=1 Tax=Nocardioides sp. C4-1 TaxID=3151851 RepID=UPI00326448A8